VLKSEDSRSGVVTGGTSVAVGEPLQAIAELIGGPRIDDLLRRAARSAPRRVALRAGETRLTYAELDEKATRCAVTLRDRLGAPGSVVAVAAVADPAFAVAFYGASRSGNISAILNPLWREDGLEHALRTSRARMAIVTPEMYERLARIRRGLPQLETVVLTEPVEGAAEVTLAEMTANASAPAEAAHDPDAVACLLFTSGTTGAPKAVMLTQRNLTVNAAQTARAHRLDERSVLLNCLPTFHLMHLNAAVCATASQVLFPADDHIASIDAATRVAATHYYSLPVRLARLAADPRLPELRAPTLRAILSGGSALSVANAATLSERFGVPVVQGYGLAETSPLTHCDPIESPRPGSCGPPLPGTECRIVHVDGREVVPLGERGEVELRGPQLMKGYLDAGPVPRGDWFATGDVGRLDEEGRLYIVDRLKDVFKCDNYLVSPSEIEGVLRRHPAVADCVVVDHPDPFRGAVACALAVSRDPAADGADLAAFVNGRVPYYQRLWRVETVDRIPRSANGKVRRADLRERVREWPLPGDPPGGRSKERTDGHSDQPSYRDR
jgi:long-chain acyl-CoA synthetase